MIEIDNIYNMDCLEGMKMMADNSVDMVVTSPPYDNLRTYGKDIDKSWGEHVWKPIIAELFRIIKDGGVIAWVVNDATIDFCKTFTSFKQALYFHECGFNMLDTMIYLKENYAPAYPNMKRYASQFEYMFIFCKGKPNTFTPIQSRKIRNREEKVAYRQKDGSLVRKVKPIGRETKDASNVWSFAVGGNDTGHPAVFPLNLARGHILSWSKEGDVVLDPFMGSATNAIACIKEHRHFIGFELNESYYNEALKRLKRERQQLTLF